MEDRKIKEFLKLAGKRIVMNLFLQSFFLYLAVGLMAGAFVHIVSLLFPIYEAMKIALGILGIILVAGLCYFLWRCPKRNEVARIVDETGTKEQFITALELEGKTDIISNLQKQKTIETIETYPVKEKLPFVFPAKRIVFSVLAFICFVIGAVMPSPAKEQAVKNHELAELVKEEVEKLEEAKKELQKVEKLSKDELKKMEEVLEQGMKEVKEVSDKAELEKEKERLETKLEEKLEKTNEEGKKLASKVLEQKKLVEKNESEKLMEQKKSQLQKELAKVQEDLKKKTASTEDSKKEEGENKGSKSDSKENSEGGQSKKEDSDNKNQGESTENTGSQNKNGENKEENGESQENASGEAGEKSSEEKLLELTESLEEALQSGNVSESDYEDLLNSLSEYNASASSGAPSSESTQQLCSQMASTLSNSSSQQMANASNQASVSQGQQSGQQQQGGGMQGNSGSGGSSGSGMSGNGSGGGTQGGNGSGGGMNYGGYEGMEREYMPEEEDEFVAISDMAVGEDENLTGKNSGGSKYSQKTTGEGWRGNSVSYDKVVGNYAEQAYSDIESDKIPNSMKSVVRSYFEGLTQ